MKRAETVGLLVGLAADSVLGDPVRWHPVAGFGKAATAVQRGVERDNRQAGAAYVLLGVVPCLALGSGLETWAKRSVRRRTAVTAAACFCVVGGHSLRREAATIQRLLDHGRLDDARLRLRSLCGRDAADLGTTELSQAVVESVAENTNDAVVGPLLWWSLAGVPGLLGYRAVNTLDAMVGHRSTRYARFGWAAARLDDLVNLMPARLAGAAAVVTAPLVAGDSRSAVRAWREDAAAHPSPNAGVVEAAFAGALGLRLGGRIDYPYGASQRPVLNAKGDPAAPADIERAIRLSRAVQAGSVAVCLAIWARRSSRRAA